MSKLYTKHVFDATLQAARKGMEIQTLHSVEVKESRTAVYQIPILLHAQQQVSSTWALLAQCYEFPQKSVPGHLSGWLNDSWALWPNLFCPELGS